MSPPVISLVGKSGAGKTTFIEKLVPLLKKRGIRVGTIKHDVHRFEIDHEGKDSYRHFHSGSDAVVIASPEKLALVKRLAGPASLDDLVAGYMADMDLVITEGYKSADKPKIEVFRDTVHKEPLCGPGDNRVALVTDADVEADCPKFFLDDVRGVARFIMTNYLNIDNASPDHLERKERLGTEQDKIHP